MNQRILWATLATFLILAGAWTTAFGTSLRDDVECNDTDKCLAGPISGTGWLTVALGIVVIVAGIASVAKATMQPPVR